MSSAPAPAEQPAPSAWPIPEGCGQVYVDKVHEDDIATPETAHLFGCAEPRICTPPLRELTPETSLGFEVIDFAKEVLGVVLYPWQRVALIRMLELLEDGSLRFLTVLILVARQNGKSTLAQVLTIWIMVVCKWPLVLGTAQDLDVAERLWAEVVEIIEKDDELCDLIAQVVKVNGKKALVLASGATYAVKATGRRAARGLSANLVLLDELREHHTWEAWAAVTKTTMARLLSLIVALSNAGDIKSVVLRYLRLIAHVALGDPDGIASAEDIAAVGPTEFDLESVNASFIADDELQLDEFDDDELEELDLEDLEQDGATLCLLEWSAPPGCSRRDRSGWSAANPSRRYFVKDRKLAEAARNDPEWVHRTEVLCQWNPGATTGPFAPGSWVATTIKTKLGETGKVEVANPAVDRIVGPVVAGIAQTIDRNFTYIAFCGERPDGGLQVEVITARNHDDWVKGWLTHKDRKGRVLAVTGQLRGAPESTLVAALAADRTFRIPMPELAGTALTDAHADMHDGLAEGWLWHLPLRELDLAASTAVLKPIAGGAVVIDTVKSAKTAETASLRACIAAHWLWEHREVAPPPPPPPPPAVDIDDRADDFDADDDGYGGYTADLTDMGF